MSDVKSSVKEFKLEKENELRIEAKGDITLQLQGGGAEIFGSELVAKKKYTFTDSKIAVFTWTGCKLTIDGKYEVAYTSEETPMVSYINTHAAIDKMRQDSKAKGSKGRGPVVMITGLQDSGKSTLSRILLSYAVRCGWQPTFVDVDVGQNEISSPGCLTACPVDQQIGIDSSWTNRAPVVYYYGHTTPAKNKEIYKKLIGRVADAVEKRCQRNTAGKHSGVIINTSGWVDGGGQELILSIAKKFKVHVILVLGQEKLVSDLKSSEELRELETTVVKLDTSGGVVSRSSNIRSALRNLKLRQYFYGR
mmetsp:Transcript_7146/g.9944  ORF Transcript_7146/g.9944 Transcript_7146/m.9944 type:complete len:307 (-) Transcript_7146:477-1397(-)